MLNLVHEGERDRGSYNHCTQSEPQGTGNKTEKTTKRKQTKEKQDKKQNMGKKETKQSKEKKKRQKTKQKRKQRSKRQKTKADSLFLVRLSFSHVLFYSQVRRAFDKFQSSYSQLVLTNDLGLFIFINFELFINSSSSLLDHSSPSQSSQPILVYRAKRLFQSFLFQWTYSSPPRKRIIYSFLF